MSDEIVMAAPEILYHGFDYATFRCACGKTEVTYYAVTGADPCSYCGREWTVDLVVREAAKAVTSP